MLENTIFEGLTFNLDTFAKSPKCTGKYFGEGGSGCLLTAFFKALGFTANKQVFFHPITKEEFAPGRLRAYVDSQLAKNILTDEDTELHNKVFTRAYGFEPSNKFNPGFTYALILFYDNGHEVEALNLIWRLIEKLPNKVGFAKQEDVIMPETCLVS